MTTVVSIRLSGRMVTSLLIFYGNQEWPVGTKLISIEVTCIVSGDRGYGDKSLEPQWPANEARRCSPKDV